jgi:hypothetical protein
MHSCMQLSAVVHRPTIGYALLAMQQVFRRSQHHHQHQGGAQPHKGRRPQCSCSAAPLHLNARKHDDAAAPEHHQQSATGPGTSSQHLATCTAEAGRAAKHPVLLHAASRCLRSRPLCASTCLAAQPSTTSPPGCRSSSHTPYQRAAIAKAGSTHNATLLQACHGATSTAVVALSTHLLPTRPRPCCMEMICLPV